MPEAFSDSFAWSSLVKSFCDSPGGLLSLSLSKRTIGGYIHLACYNDDVLRHVGSQNLSDRLTLASSLGYYSSEKLLILLSS
jgi:hypothetical protein